MTDTLTGVIFDRLPDHARPLLTYYDEGTGERTELSGATLGNWAAKLANFLRDEAGVAPGDAVRVDLPEHWQTAAVLLGAWWAGARVLIGDHDGDAAVAFVARDRLDGPAGDADTVVAVPLDPFAMGVRDLPVGVDDFGESIRAHGDRYSPGGAGEFALNDLSTAELGAIAYAAQPGDRVLSTLPWTTADDIRDHFLAPLFAGASLVWVRGADEDRLARIAETEKTDTTLA